MTDGQADAKLIEMSEGVKILYKGAIDNLIFLKRQQWIITNYALVVYAAVVTIARGGGVHEKWGLSIVAFAAWAYGTWCLIHTQNSMTKLRVSLYHIYQTYFTEEERAAYGVWDKPPTFNYTPEFFYGLVVAHVIALAMSIYLIWQGLPVLRATG